MSASAKDRAAGENLETQCSRLFVSRKRRSKIRSVVSLRASIMIVVRSDTVCTLNPSARKKMAIFSRSAEFSPATKIVTRSRLIYLYVKQGSNSRHFLPGF